MRLYIDPGTGSMLFTILIGILGTGLYLGRNALVKLRFLFTGGAKNSGNNRRKSSNKSGGNKKPQKKEAE